MALLQLILPAMAIILFIQFKLKGKLKEYFWKVPVLVSSTALSIGVGHLAKGVMGPYGGFLADIVIYPTLVFMKRREEKKQEKLRKKTTAILNSKLGAATC